MLDALEGCKKVGIRNIVALRGDPPAGQAAWEAVEGGFSCALDLVKFIRAEHGDFFCLSVAGYPEGHPSKMTVVTDLSSLTPSELGRCSKLVNEQGVEETYVCLDSDYEKELDYLKQKVDAGADCIITQLFFDVNVFLSFVQQCRKKGITVPIIPGIMCVSSAGGFQRMTKFCRTRVPEDLAAAAASMKEDEEMKAFGVSYITTMCEKLIESNISGLHFYTLNSSHATMEIVQNLKKKYTIRQASTPANQEDILETVFTNVEQNKMSV